MAHHNPIESSILQFAKLAREHGWTKEEVQEVVDAVQEDIKKDVVRGACRIDSLLWRHARPIVERKMKEQENKED